MKSRQRFLELTVWELATGCAPVWDFLAVGMDFVVGETSLKRQKAS